MYTLYEGSVKVGFESNSILELLSKLNFEKGEKEYGEEYFHGNVDLYETPKEWADWVEGYHFEDDLDCYDDEEDRERQSREWLKDTHMPRTISKGQVVIYFDGLRDEYKLFDGDPDLESVNESLARCFPDNGYRVVDE